MFLLRSFSPWGLFGITCTLLSRRAILADHRFERAVASQAAMPELQSPIFQCIGAALFLLGNTFVLSSMYALGITGTYLGTFHTL